MARARRSGARRRSGSAARGWRRARSRRRRRCAIACSSRRAAPRPMRRAAAPAATSAGSTRFCDHVVAAIGARGAGEGRRRLSAAARAKSRARHFGFYSAAEFEVGALIARHPALAIHGARPLLRRRGLSRQAHDRDAVARRLGLCAAPRVDVMFGCASLPGADPAAHAGGAARRWPALRRRAGMARRADRSGARAPKPPPPRAS